MNNTKNETMNDFALKAVPESARKWTALSLFSILLGMSTAMFFFLFGGMAVKLYGMTYLIIGLIIVAIISGSLSFFLILIASETGLDIDLITCSSVGYKGACITSLIYGASYIIYFALEASIIAESIHSQYTFIPMPVLYTFVALAFVLLTWYGITIMNYIMWLSLPIYLVGIAWFIHVVKHMPYHFDIFSYQHAMVDLHGGPILLQLIVMFLAPTIAGALASADIGRFIPRKNNVLKSLILGYCFAIFGYLGVCLLGAWIGTKLSQSDPGIYLPAILGGFGTLVVIISQIRINTINTYSGSLAFSTFFSRLIGFTPGRQYWVIFLAIASLILMFFDIIKHVNNIFTFLAIFLISWTSVILTDILYNKSLFKITPKNFPIERGTIPDYNYVGLIALVMAILVGLPLSFGLCGPLWITLAPFVSGTVAIFLVLLLSNLKYMQRKG